MNRKPLSDEVIAQLFTAARTHHVWTDKSVSDETLHKIYEIMKWGPTSVNSNPGRIVFVKSPPEKEKLLTAVTGSNVQQIKAAPVTAIMAWDEKWLNQIGKLWTANDVRPYFEGNEKLIYDTAFRNSSLQGAYMILAIRALGLDACPMSGFDNAKVDSAFFSGTSWRSNFICTLGHGDDAKLYPRGPRLAFEESCKIL
jgi:3-hydroxypropanoate dehydrogenase